MNTITLCFKTRTGIMVIIPEIFTNRPVKEKPLLVLTDQGLALQYQNYEIPIPEDMFDYVTEHRIITLYDIDGSKYMQNPATAIEIPKELIIEAKGVFRYRQKTAAGLD